MYSEIIELSSSTSRFVLIDDDHTYQAIMKQCARHRGFELEVYTSLEDLGSVGMLGRYDAAIVDYDLGNINGVEIAEYMNSLFGSIPMILVSSSHREPGDQPWPKVIKRFVNKSDGYEHVLDQARRSLLEANLAKEISR